MGFEPTISSVTGRRVIQATLRPHKFLLHWLGWESNPRPWLYECHALTNLATQPHTNYTTKKPRVQFGGGCYGKVAYPLFFKSSFVARQDSATQFLNHSSDLTGSSPPHISTVAPCKPCKKLPFNNKFNNKVGKMPAITNGLHPNSPWLPNHLYKTDASILYP